MAIHKGKIGKEDISFGTGTFTRKGKTGFDITLNQVKMSDLPIGLVHKTSNYTMNTSDLFLSVDATTGAITITLPSAVGLEHEVTIVKTDTSTNDITLNTNGTETINGDSSKIISGQYSVIRLLPYNGNWIITAIRGVVY